MREQVTVECELTTEVPDNVYRDSDDKWKNALFLSTRKFHELNIDPFTYVRSKPVERNGSRGAILYAVPFREDVASEYEDIHDIGALRSNLMRKIDPDLRKGDCIEVEAIEYSSSDCLKVKDSFADEITGEICYLHPILLDQLGVETDGETVEAYNPITGSRMLLGAWETRLPSEGTEVISIDGYSRSILGTELGDEVKVREKVNKRSGSWLLKMRNAILRSFVGQRVISLRVKSGLYRDEHRNIARVHEDMFEFLGIDRGDQIVVTFKGRSLSVQCLPAPEDELNNIDPISIHLPSTSRDIIEACIDDGIHVSRDMGYIFKKKASLSALGIIGVVLSAITLINIPLAEYPTVIQNHPVISIGVLMLLFMISLVLVWFILYPERQRCVGSEVRKVSRE